MVSQQKVLGSKLLALLGELCLLCFLCHKRQNMQGYCWLSWSSEERVFLHRKINLIQVDTIDPLLLDTVSATMQYSTRFTMFVCFSL